MEACVPGCLGGRVRALGALVVMADPEDRAGRSLGLGDLNPEVSWVTLGQSLSMNLLHETKCGRPCWCCLSKSITPFSTTFRFSFEKPVLHLSQCVSLCRSPLLPSPNTHNRQSEIVGIEISVCFFAGAEK